MKRWRVGLGLFLALGLPLALIVVRQFPPTENSFYPRCMLHLVTGLHCPGCGMTRALHALLHLDWRQALAYNALFVALLPVLGVLLLNGVNFVARGRPLWLVRWPRWGTWAFIVIYVAFGIARNLPMESVRWLSPHALQTQR